MPFVKIGGVKKQWLRLIKKENRISLSHSLMGEDIWKGLPRAFIYYDKENHMIAIEPTADFTGNKVTGGRITSAEYPSGYNGDTRFPARYDEEKGWIIANLHQL
jgi:hypothetical protein